MSISVILKLLIFSYVTKAISFTFGAECCSPESILYNMRALNVSEYDGCFHLANDISVRFHDGPNTVDKIESPFGFGLKTNRELNSLMELPHCERTSFRNISRLSQTSATVSINSCLLMLDNNLFAVTCNSTTTNNNVLQTIGFINKCCPRGFTYTSGVNKCFESESELNVYSTIFDKPMIFMDSFACPNNKVIVEYVESAETVFLEESQLVWRDESRVLTKSDYCLDAIDDIKIRASASFEKIKQTQQFIIRSCQQPQVCNSLPCIRKCCGDGEIYYKNNITTFCKKEDNSLKVQSLTSSNISGNFTESSGIFVVIKNVWCI